MGSAAALTGFVLLLLSVPVVQGWDVWGVTYTSTEVCALRGSTVELSCTSTHPPPGNGDTFESFWFTKVENGEAVDLTSDSEYTGRVTSTCHEKRCTLRITDVRKSDSAEYKFRIMTKQPYRRFTGAPGVTLTVTDLQVNRFWPSDMEILECLSDCPLPPDPSYVWYENEHRLQGETSSSLTARYRDIYSCALHGLEDFPSPPLRRGEGWYCIVRYANRRICSPKGSSVDISSSYYCDDRIESKAWFSPGLSGEWPSPSQVPGRVQVLDGNERSVLRISNLTGNDSAEYCFKLKGFFGWLGGSPGITLTVTELQVQVRRITADRSHSVPELKCHSSCSPADPLSYVWFRNGDELTAEETSSLTARVPVGEEISCALKGHEGFPSPAVYAPKLPSVSVSPSGEVVEGSSVTLTCSTDANPAANYTWYKEDKDSILAKEPIFTITEFRAEHSGKYVCEAENVLGSQSSTVHLTVQSDKSLLITNAIKLALVVAVPLLVLLVSLRMRRRSALSSSADPNKPAETMELESDPDGTDPSASHSVSADRTSRGSQV